MKNDKQIAIYSRKSRFTGKGESVENQVEMCRQYIATHYGEAAAKNALVYEDEGFSGANLERPRFKRMMADAKAQKFSVIVVYRLDRISRNTGDFAKLIEQLNDMHIDFVSIRERFDPDNPMGRAMMYVASIFSQLERETIAERIRDNMHELAKTGRWLGGNTPTGYTSESVSKVTVDGKTRKSCHLKLNPEEAEMVKTIYDLYLETDSLTATETELLRRRIQSKTGRDHTRFSIKAILQNPVYLIADEDAYRYFTDRNIELYSDSSAFDGKHGIMAYNRTEQEKGKSTVYLPMEEWIIAVGRHPGLIPSKQWIRVQESLERNKSKAYRKARNNEALLTGLLFCSCGHRMYPKLSNRVNAAGEPVYTYVCKMKERSKKERCAQKNANGNQLDAAIVEQIKLLSSDDQTFIDQLAKSKDYYTGSREQYDAQLEDLRKEMEENQKAISGLVDSLSVVGEIPAAKIELAKRISELTESNQKIENRIHELEGLTSANALSDMEFDLLRQLMVVFSAGVDEMTVEQKRAAIRTVVRKVIWDGRRAHVILFGAEEGEIEYPQICTKDDLCEDSK